MALIGDFMPLGFADAAGRQVAGNSLDNTVRVGERAGTGWVLLDIQIHQIANGFGHGRAALWSDDGVLLGEVSQTSIMRTHSRILESTKTRTPSRHQRT
jgi:acyl-CoA thioesterase